MHVVHYNSDKYHNISIAMDKSDGLGVLGVLIEVSILWLGSGGRRVNSIHNALQHLERIPLTVPPMQVGEFNPLFEKFLRFINGIKYRGKFNVKSLEQLTFSMHNVSIYL